MNTQSIQVYTWIRVAIVKVGYKNKLNKPEWESMERGVKVEKGRVREVVLKIMKNITRECIALTTIVCHESKGVVN